MLQVPATLYHRDSFGPVPPPLAIHQQHHVALLACEQGQSTLDLNAEGQLVTFLLVVNSESELELVEQAMDGDGRADYERARMVRVAEGTPKSPLAAAAEVGKALTAATLAAGADEAGDDETKVCEALSYPPRFPSVSPSLFLYLSLVGVVSSPLYHDRHQKSSLVVIIIAIKPRTSVYAHGCMHTNHFHHAHGHQQTTTYLNLLKKDEPEMGIRVGDKVLFKNRSVGIVRFVGDTEFSKGEVVYGVDLVTPDGKHDGTVGPTTYFSCEPYHGIFAKLKHLKLLPPDDDDQQDEEDAAAVAAREEARRRREKERQVCATKYQQPSLCSPLCRALACSPSTTLPPCPCRLYACLLLSSSLPSRAQSTPRSQNYWP